MTNPSRLLTVPFVLRVLNVGLVAFVFFPNRKQAAWIRPGLPLVFVRPDGSTFRTFVKVIDMRKNDSATGQLVGIVLPNNVEKADIPYPSMMREP